MATGNSATENSKEVSLEDVRPTVDTLLTQWIEENNIRKRQCARFVPDPDVKQCHRLSEFQRLCKCGHEFQNHSNLAKDKWRQDIANRQQSKLTADSTVCATCQKSRKNHLDNSHDFLPTIRAIEETWNWFTDTEAREVTDTFGNVQFDIANRRSGRAKYVRLSAKSDDRPGTSPSDRYIQTVTKLMFDVWKITPPELLISLIGGTKHFKLEKKLLDKFKRGVFVAAQFEGTWLLTDGTNSEITKQIGGILKDYAISQRRVTSVGIVPWGYIKNNQNLTTNVQEDAVYKLDGLMADDTVLEPNHAHFLLVDTGTQNQRNQEAAFRTALEKRLYKGGDIAKGAPIVKFVLGGDLGTLDEVHKALKNEIPTVIVKGSGGITDILAEFHAWPPGNLDLAVRKKVQEAFKLPTVPVALITIILECLESNQYLTVYEVDPSSPSAGFDTAILQSLFSAKTCRAVDLLRLSIAWDSAELARDVLKDAEPGELADMSRLIKVALKENKTDCVEAFIDYGFDFSSFENPEEIQSLDSRDAYYRRYHSIFGHVGGRIRLVLQMLFRPMYHSRRYHAAEYTFNDFDKNSSNNSINSLAVRDFKATPEINEQSSDKSTEPANGKPRDKETEPTSGKPRDKAKEREKPSPAFCLFVWAVLNDYHDMAKLFWEKGKTLSTNHRDPMALALIGYSLMHAKSKLAKDTEDARKLQDHAREFGLLATGVLRQCYSERPDITRDLLIRKIEYLGNTTCIEIALESRNRNFISSQACRSLIVSVWNGDICPGEKSALKKLVCTLCPVLAPCLLQFNERPTHKYSAITGSESKLTLEDEETNQKSRCLSWGQKYMSFFNAPSIAFMYNMLSYFVFLVLFSFVLVVEMEPYTATVEDGLLVVWVFSFLVEEIRQLIDSRLAYIKDAWNIIDASSIFLFLLGMFLRLSSSKIVYDVARVFLCLDIVLFYIRVLHIFLGIKELGPKLLMIGKMLRDLCYFMVILLVFIVAYAVSSYALLFPNSSLAWNTLLEVFRRPYWNIYGELFLEVIEGDEACSSDANSTEARCPTEVGTSVVPILMGFYMLIVNVLLLNLLIAMFSYTFQVIQENNVVHWNYLRYLMILEYYDRPRLCPPFILLTHLQRLLRQLCRSCTARSTGRIARKFPKDIDERLYTWENCQTLEFILRAEKDNADNVKRRLDILIERTDKKESSVQPHAKPTPFAMEQQRPLQGALQLSQLHSGLDALQSQVYGISAAVNEVRSDLNGMKGEQKDMNQKVRGLGNQQSQIANELSGVKNEILIIKQNLTGIQHEQEKMNEELSGTNQEVKDVKQNVIGVQEQQIRTMTDIETVQKSQDSIELRVVGLSDRSQAMEDLQSKMNITTQHMLRDLNGIEDKTNTIGTQQSKLMTELGRLKTPYV